MARSVPNHAVIPDFLGGAEHRPFYYLKNPRTK